MKGYLIQVKNVLSEKTVGLLLSEEDLLEATDLTLAQLLKRGIKLANGK